jgi:hypothetical protein
MCEDLAVGDWGSSLQIQINQEIRFTTSIIYNQSQITDKHFNKQIIGNAMFLRNFLIMTFVLSPALILFGMIIFAGKPKDQLKQDEVKSGKEDSI